MKNPANQKLRDVLLLTTFLLCGSSVSAQNPQSTPNRADQFAPGAFLRAYQVADAASALRIRIFEPDVFVLRMMDRRTDSTDSNPNVGPQWSLFFSLQFFFSVY